MDGNMELILFAISIIWFLIITSLFVAYIKIRFQKDEIDNIKSTIDKSNNKLKFIHDNLKNIKKE